MQVVVAAALIVAAGVLAYRSGILAQSVVVSLVASGVTFLVYAFDKSAARKGARRTPESTLHLLSLIGGWPGAFAAQRILRHKSRKASFRFVFWLTVALNLVILAWLGTPHGRAVFEKLLRSIG